MGCRRIAKLSDFDSYNGAMNSCYIKENQSIKLIISLFHMDVPLVTMYGFKAKTFY